MNIQPNRRKTKDLHLKKDFYRNVFTYFDVLNLQYFRNIVHKFWNTLQQTSRSYLGPSQQPARLAVPIVLPIRGSMKWYAICCCFLVSSWSRLPRLKNAALFRSKSRSRIKFPLPESSTQCDYDGPRTIAYAMCQLDFLKCNL